MNVFSYSCDVYSSIIKQKLDRAVNSGMDAATPEEIAEGICCLQGVSNVIIQLGSIVGKAKKPPQKVNPIRSLHEFIFTSSSVKVKRVSGIGQGKTITLNPDEFEFTSYYAHRIVNENQLLNGKPRRFTLNPMPGAVELQEDVAKPADDIVFDCKLNKNCLAEFGSIDELKLHQDAQWLKVARSVTERVS